MRKVRFEADELFVVALFEADTRTHTIDAINEAIPFVEDDAEAYAVVISTVEKLKQQSDMEFHKLELAQYLQDAEEDEEE